MTSDTTLHPDDHDVRQLFDRLLADEPTLGLDAGTAWRSGRRLRRRRQLATGLVGMGAVVAVGAAATGLVLLQGDDGGTVTTDSASPSSPGSGSAPDGGQGWEEVSPVGEQMLRAIHTSSPPGWSFDLVETGELDGPGGGLLLEGTADDGTGPGRLVVSLSVVPGQQELHPCGAPDFTLGASCDEVPLADGAILSVRGLVDRDGQQTVAVMLTHPDGTGVSAESGNFVLATPGEVAAGAEAAGVGNGAAPVVVDSRAGVTRTGPTYTTEQLTAVVEAVDAAVLCADVDPSLSGCRSGG